MSVQDFNTVYVFEEVKYGHIMQLNMCDSFISTHIWIYTLKKIPILLVFSL